MSIGKRIQDHYGIYAQRAAILGTLAAAGKNIEALSVDDLAPFDQLHTSGRGATMHLMEALDARAQDCVLDVGCGIGGPARLLSAARACRVVGVDFTAGFVATATDFSRRCQMDGATSFVVGSAAALPMPGQTFDRAWHIHMSMNVPDKAAMYAEIFRVLKPGAKFAMYDPIAGPGPEPQFPLPWAKTPETSFLLPRAALFALIEKAGFVLRSASDHTAQGLGWLIETERQRAQLGGSAIPGAIRDPIFAEMTANHRANLEQGAVNILCAVFEKVAE